MSNTMSPVNANDFNQLMESFANFRDAYDPLKQRICFSPKGLISLGGKAKGFRRLCEFFYKPSHLRLSKVIEKTIAFLEKNEKNLSNEDNLQRLISFRTKVISISNVTKKVGSGTLNRFDTLVAKVRKNIEQQKKDKEQEALNKADIFLKEAERTKKEKEKEVLEFQNDISNRSKTVLEEIEKEKADRAKMVEEKLNVRLSAIDRDYFLTYKLGDTFHLESTDLTFISEDGVKVSSYSVLFPRLLANAKQQGNAYEISLKGYEPPFISDRIVDFLKFYQHAQLPLQGLKIQQLLNFYLMALKLVLPEFANELKEFIFKICEQNGMLYFIMLDYDKATNPFLKDKSILSMFLYRIDTMPISELSEVPKSMLRKFRDELLIPVKDDLVCRSYALSILSTLDKIL